MRFELFMTREYSTDILVALLAAGFSVGPCWSAPGAASKDDVELFSVSGEDGRFYERLKAALEPRGFSFDYRGCVYPATGFGAIVQALELSPHEQARLSDLLANPETLASQEDHDLVASYEKTLRERKLYHVNLASAAHELKARKIAAGPSVTV